jgi:transcriptional regulator with XRE-family HTH domain
MRSRSQARWALDPSRFEASWPSFPKSWSSTLRSLVCDGFRASENYSAGDITICVAGPAARRCWRRSAPFGGAPRLSKRFEIRQERASREGRQHDLSKASGVGTATIRRIENGGSPIMGYVSTVMRIEAAFEKAGILFITDDEIAGIGSASQEEEGTMSARLLTASLPWTQLRRK